MKKWEKNQGDLVGLEWGDETLMVSLVVSSNEMVVVFDEDEPVCNWEGLVVEYRPGDAQTISGAEEWL